MIFDRYTVVGCMRAAAVSVLLFVKGLIFVTNKLTSSDITS